MIPYHKTVSGTPVGPLLYRVLYQSGVPYHPSKPYQKKNASIYIDTASIRLRYASDTCDIAWILVQKTETICTENQACPLYESFANFFVKVARYTRSSEIVYGREL